MLLRLVGWHGLSTVQGKDRSFHDANFFPVLSTVPGFALVFGPIFLFCKRRCHCFHCLSRFSTSSTTSSTLPRLVCVREQRNTRAVHEFSELNECVDMEWTLQQIVCRCNIVSLCSILLNIFRAIVHVCSAGTSETTLSTDISTFAPWQLQPASWIGVYSTTLEQHGQEG